MDTPTNIPPHEDRPLTSREQALVEDMLAEIDARTGARAGPRPDQRVAVPPRPCFVVGSLNCGGAQVLTLRWAKRLPQWIQDRTTVWSRYWPMCGWALVGAARREGHGATIVRERPKDATHWVLSSTPLPARPFPPDRTTLVLHTQDAQQNREMYGLLPAVDVLAVSQATLRGNAAWLESQHHRVKGVLPPTYAQVDGRPMCADIDFLRAVYVGRPSAAKGFHMLPDLLALDPGLHITAWTGSDVGHLGATDEARSVEEVTRKAQELGVSDRFVVRGYNHAVDHYDKLYNDADVLLLLSHTEGQPLVVGEALSCGVPVVATAVGGIPEVIRDGVNGVLVPPPDSAGWHLGLVVQAIERARALDTSECKASVASLSFSEWQSNHLPLLLRQFDAEIPETPDARVTVVVMLPADANREWMDECMASIAGQRYRSFRVVLVVQGESSEPWGTRYRVPAWSAEGEAHAELIRTCTWTEFVAPVPYGLRLCNGYLGQAVQMMDQLGLDMFLSPVAAQEECESPPHAWAPAGGVAFWRGSVLRAHAEPHRQLCSDHNSLVVGR